MFVTHTVTSPHDEEGSGPPSGPHRNGQTWSWRHSNPMVGPAPNAAHSPPTRLPSPRHVTDARGSTSVTGVFEPFSIAEVLTHTSAASGWTQPNLSCESPRTEQNRLRPRTSSPNSGTDPRASPWIRLRLRFHTSGEEAPPVLAPDLRNRTPRLRTGLRDHLDSETTWTQP